jgi:predicted ATP-binding protein involved in virulence
MAKTTKKVVAKQGRSGESPEISPVYFLSLEVDQILCFKNKQTLNLMDKDGKPMQWTVILGDNGVGKTTLLRCLAGMQVKKEVGARSKDASPLLFSLGEPISAWKDINFLQNHGFPSVHANLACEMSLVAIHSQNTKNRFQREKIEVVIGSMSSLVEWSAFQGLICYGYGAIRNLGDVVLQDSLKSPSSTSLFSEGAALINAEEWLLQTDYAYRSATGATKMRLKKQLDHIIDILKRILPDVNAIRIAIPDNDSYEDEPHPRAEFRTPYGWVHINSLGLGYRTAIAWMVDLAVRLFRRYPHSPDPLAEPAIVLVDEIDLHLHPRWQRTIMDFLTDRFPNTQFIVTAHSPLVVQAAQNANIVLLRREGDRVVIDNDPEIIENWRVDQVLTSVFELPSSRPAKLDKWLKDREKLLSKAHLTEADEAKLQTLAKQIGSLPMSDAPEDIEAKDIIRRAAKLLKKAG